MQFIRATDRVPSDSKYKNCKIDGCPIVLFYSEHHKLFHDMAGDAFPIDLIEWLDESGPSLSISDIGAAWKHCCELWEERSGRSIPSELFHKYLKDKYNIDVDITK